MSELVTISFIGFLLFSTFFPLYIAMKKKREVRYRYDKSIIYLCSEMSFYKEGWDNVHNQINHDDSTIISIPNATIWRGMILYQFKSISQLYYILAAVYIFTLFLLFSFGIGLKFSIIDFFEALMFTMIFISLCLYYFRSFSADNTELFNKINVTVEYFQSLGWNQINQKILETLKEEVKVDFDQYKNSQGLGGLILLLASSTVVYYFRILSDQTNELLIILLVLIFSITITKWFYESYRNRIVYIALNSLLELIKIQQMEEIAVNKSVKLIGESKMGL